MQKVLLEQKVPNSNKYQGWHLPNNPVKNRHFGAKNWHSYRYFHKPCTKFIKRATCFIKRWLCLINLPLKSIKRWLCLKKRPVKSIKLWHWLINLPHKSIKRWLWLIKRPLKGIKRPLKFCKRTTWRPLQANAASQAHGQAHKPTAQKPTCPRACLAQRTTTSLRGDTGSHYRRPGRRVCIQHWVWQNGGGRKPCFSFLFFNFAFVRAGR